MSEWLKWGGREEERKGGSVPKILPLWFCPFSALEPTAPVLRGESAQLYTSVLPAFLVSSLLPPVYTALLAAGLTGLLPLQHALPIPHAGHVHTGLPPPECSSWGSKKEAPYEELSLRTYLSLNSSSTLTS